MKWKINEEKHAAIEECLASIYNQYVLSRATVCDLHSIIQNLQNVTSKRN